MSRNMDNNNYAGEDSEGSEEHDRETIITLENTLKLS